MFFYIYLKANPSCEGKLCFVLPTGGGGNISAGLLARRMGLPIDFVVALNKNASFSRFFNFFDVADDNEGYEVPVSIGTIAPAMDMGFPYNFPRIAHLASENDGAEPSSKFLSFPPYLVVIDEHFTSESVCQ